MGKFFVIFTLLVCLSVVTAHFSNFPRSTKSSIRNKRIVASECPKVTCIAPGTSCDPTSDTLLCLNSTCEEGTSAGNYSCVPESKGKTGDSCSTDEFCLSNECINGRCNADGNPGTPCMMDDECVYYNNSGNAFTRCVNGVCAGAALGESCSESSCLPPLFCNRSTSVHVCATPQALGGQCSGNDNSYCAYPLVCYNSSCSVPLPIGSVCYDIGSSCANFSECVANSSSAEEGKCVEWYSLPAGSYCGDDVFCADGLLWIDDTCVVAPRNSSFANCTTTDSSMCAVGEACKCNPSLGYTQCIRDEYSIPIGAYNATKAYFQCYERCKANSTCFYQNCLPYECALNQVFEDSDIDKSVNPPCIDPPSPPTSYIELYCAANPPVPTSTIGTISGASISTAGSTGTSAGSSSSTTSSSLSSGTTADTSAASFVCSSLLVVLLSIFVLSL